MSTNIPKKLKYQITEVSDSFVFGKIDLEDMDYIVSEIDSEIESGCYEPGLIGTNDDGDLNEETRSSTISWLTKSKKVFKKIKNVVDQINDQFFDLDISTKPCSYQYTLYDNPLDHYNWHKDQYKKDHFTDGYIRTLSLSLCLTSSEFYEGAELFVRDNHKLNVRVFKMGYGDFVIFPANVTHRVNALREGTRASFVAWYGYENTN